jgi:hypothetical protein
VTFYLTNFDHLSAGVEAMKTTQKEITHFLCKPSSLALELLGYPSAFLRLAAPGTLEVARDPPPAPVSSDSLGVGPAFHRETSAFPPRGGGNVGHPGGWYIGDGDTEPHFPSRCLSGRLACVRARASLGKTGTF